MSSVVPIEDLEASVTPEMVREESFKHLIGMMDLCISRITENNSANYYKHVKGFIDFYVHYEGVYIVLRELLRSSGFDVTFRKGKIITIHIYDEDLETIKRKFSKAASLMADANIIDDHSSVAGDYELYEVQARWEERRSAMEENRRSYSGEGLVESKGHLNVQENDYDFVEGLLRQSRLYNWCANAIRRYLPFLSSS